ncbi:hypothetical protein ACHAP5_004853 [Fusarium lateritium]
MVEDPDWIPTSNTRKPKIVKRSMQRARKTGRIDCLPLQDRLQDRNFAYVEKSESGDELTDQEFEETSRNLSGTTTLARRAVADIQADPRKFVTKKQFDELSQKFDSITALEEQNSAKINKEIERLGAVVIPLQTKVSRLERQTHCEQFPGHMLDSSDDKQPAGTHSSRTSSKLSQYQANCESLEAAKRQVEKEKAGHLCLIRELRLELEEKQKAADEERAESERKDDKIIMLRESMLEKDRILRQKKERCEELEAVLQTAQQQRMPEAFGEDQIKSVHDTTTKEVKQSRDGRTSARKRRRSHSASPDEEENIFAQHMRNLALRVGYFTVFDDGEFDLNMAATVISHIGNYGDYSHLRSFFDYANRDRGFCLQDAADRGTSALGLNVKKCSQHESVRCILVRVTLVDSTRQLRFTYDRPHATGY